MRVVFSEKAWQDYTAFVHEDRAVLTKVNALVKAIPADPCDGIGKPEPLKHDLAGYWSRRITREHRLVYRVVGEELWIAQVGTQY